MRIPELQEQKRGVEGTNSAGGSWQRFPIALPQGATRLGSFGSERDPPSVSLCHADGGCTEGRAADPRSSRSCARFSVTAVACSPRPCDRRHRCCPGFHSTRYLNSSLPPLFPREKPTSFRSLRVAPCPAAGAARCGRPCFASARPLSRPAPLPPRRTSGAASSVQTAAPTSPAALLIPPSEGRAPAGNTYVKSEGSDPRRPRRARGTFPELARCAARAAFHAPLTSPNSLTRPAAPLRTASKAPGIHPP